uniref:Uncharacterized protein C1orf21 homolog isoform X2 n=1 Tax=Geotrypetes seraphini TaxID=260995 RepID=A0A6P8P8U4_GEOSA|nr:uncharacterized protein C1orf21 homolog isoform X2 [Geotrypetes seraphini]XP_033771947.1 uncharacterized protein C1orf21 homolog isoform X2 [Geotrypetes seraphini]XP_033771948.1 uncharacterized protein C1orf21 homolog isoform X2 [Geotrypetes seraphini]XP_033771950.1 uncharacterized protein C1orf21 homolog isoform X2 [Geotrypetes seraphini]XP_033771951.1 uncharacterized protein C1orf21 homolog isoform X2 [Geotrypetes seraphini]
MGCASAKQVSTVPSDEEAQRSKSYQNGDAFGAQRLASIIQGQHDEYRIKPVEEVKYMKNGEEEEKKIAAKNQENLVRILLSFSLKEKSATSQLKAKTNKGLPGMAPQPKSTIHISDSQQEFFRMLDEKIEKGHDYYSEEDIT